VPTPLPSPEVTLLTPPDRSEVRTLSRGVISAVAGPSGLSATQHALVVSLFHSMTGYPADFSGPPISAEEFASCLGNRSIEFRTRMVQIMVLCALVLRPLPAEIAERVNRFASELMVDEGMLEVARELSEGALGLAAVDFDRNGYTGAWNGDATDALHTSQALRTAWDTCIEDAALAARWASLEEYPPATLGRRITDFYRARGFVYPGRPGSAPPLLAQHDWVHVLANYGTTVESELEVFGFIARANDDMHAFSLLAMVVSLFETGYLERGAGLFEASPGHLSRTGMAARLADAMRRGAQCPGSTDFLRLDWFSLADQPVEALRRELGIPPKSPEALAAGSVGPWEPGGISEFQLKAGRELAQSQEG
jgi:hypothetical protein